MKANIIFILLVTCIGLKVSGQTATISGKVGLGVLDFSRIPENFEIVLKNINSNDSIILPLNTTEYRIEGVVLGEKYKLYTKYSGNNNFINGVSTLDLVLIIRHILGLDVFNNGYKQLAADVNNDGKVTVLDMVIIRKLILGITQAIPVNWKFRVAGGNTNQEFIEFINLNGDKDNQDFIIIKSGDINGSTF